MLYPALLIAVMALCTILLRFLPFWIFDHESDTPAYILYLGRVLPPAGIGMLVVYCLRETDLFHAPYGLPEMIAVLAVILLQAVKRNAILSILGGTLIYMILIRMM